MQENVDLTPLDLNVVESRHRKNIKMVLEKLKLACF